MSKRVLYNLNHFKINVGRMLLSTGCIYISSIPDGKMLRAFAQTKWNEKPCIMQISVQSLMRIIVIELGR